mgnify:CR=1 FL=1
MGRRSQFIASALGVSLTLGLGSERAASADAERTSAVAAERTPAVAAERASPAAAPTSASTEGQLAAARAFQAAHRAFEAGDYETARRRYEETWQLSPHPNALYNLALSCERMLDFDAAIAAFERTLPYPKMRLDAYARGDAKALSEAEKSSLSVFMQTGCAQCHFGPRLTNDAFHAVRMPTGRADGLADRGRRDGLALLAKSEFSRSSRYADAPSAVSPARDADDTTLGAFKTPSLRGVAGGGPFGHGGAIPSLIEVTEHYGRRGLPEGDPRTTGAFEPWLPHFDEAAQWALVPFLESLKAE